MMSHSVKRAYIIVLAGAFVFLLLQLWLAAREDYEPDEGFTVRRVEAAWSQVWYPFTVRFLTQTDPFDKRNVYDMNPPLYFLVVRTFAGAEPGGVLLRLFSIIPIVAGIFFLAAFASRFRRDNEDEGESVAAILVVAAAWALSPAVIFFAHQARPYAMAMGVACLTLYLMRRFAKNWLVFALSLCLTTMAGVLINFHYTWFAVALCFAFALMWWVRDSWLSRRNMAIGWAAIAAGVIGAALVLYPQRELFDFIRQNYSQELTWTTFLRGISYPLIGQWWLWGEPFLRSAVVLEVIVLLAAIYYLPRARRRADGILALSLWLIPLFMPFAAHVIIGAALYERYVIFSLPGWVLTLAWLADEGSHRRGTFHDFAIVLIGAIVIHCVAWSHARLPWPLRMEWRPAVEALLDQAQPKDYYTIDPVWQNMCFAANADGRPPAAQYIRLSDPIPDDALVIWFLSDQALPKLVIENLQNKGWLIEPVVPFHGKFLWKALRPEKVEPPSDDEEKK